MQQSTLDPYDLMTSKEVAELTRYKEATIRWMRHVGRGPRAVVIPGGRRVLYRRADVQAWIDSGEQSEPAALASR